MQTQDVTLETALIEYVQRYGLSDTARIALSASPSIRQNYPPSSPEGTVKLMSDG